jgi:uncharacterized protein (UPF0335 family)
MAGPGRNAQSMLVGYIEQIEKLKDDRKDISEHISAVMAEAKSAGFQPKIVRNVLKIRAIDPKDFEEEMAATNQYLRAVGMHEIDLSAAHDL